MIGRITETLIEKNPPHLLVDCHGIGYEIGVPMSTFYNLPATGEKAVLLTQQIVREDARLLYGFNTVAERKTSHQLIKISGVDAHIVLTVLSGMSVAEFMQTVTLQKAGRLTRIPGIGKKTVGRLLLELKGRLGVDLGVVSDGPTVSDDVVGVLSTLLALGYSGKGVTLAIKQVPTGTGVSEGIELALKTLSRG